MDKRTMNIEKRIYVLNKKIKEANKLRAIFSSTAAGTAFVACLLILVYASIKDASTAVSIIIFTLCFILFGGFIFSIAEIIRRFKRNFMDIRSGSKQDHFARLYRFCK